MIGCDVDDLHILMYEIQYMFNDIKIQVLIEIFLLEHILIFQAF